MRNFLPLVFLGCFLFSSAFAQGDSDSAVMAEMQAKAKPLKDRLLRAEMPAEQIKIQQELAALMQETLPKLSPTGRALFEVSLKIIQPLQQQSEAYLTAVDQYGNSPDSDLATLKSRDEIGPRLAALDALEAQNRQLSAKLDSFEKDIRTYLDQVKIDPLAKQGFMEGLNRGLGGQIGPMRAIRNLDNQSYQQLKKIYQHLDSNWGKWKFEEAEGFVWDEPALEEKFLSLVKELESIAERQTNAQQVLIERTDR